MGKMKRVLRCFNCGAILQSKSKNKRGFISPKVFNNERADEMVLYCNSCYEKITMLNKDMLEKDADENILRILDDAVASDALILWTVDLFMFNGFINPEIVKKVKKNKIIVIGTKRDLFSSSIKDSSFVQFIKERFNEAGIKPEKIMIFGNEDKADFKEIIPNLQKVREGKDVYLIGSSQSGKTSFINKLLRNYQNTSKRVIKSTFYPGTESKVLEIPLSNSSSLYEVPSFSLVNTVPGKVEKEIAKMIIPKKSIKHTTKVLAPGQCVSIGSLAIFELISGKNTSFHLYTSEMCETHSFSESHSEEFITTNTYKRLVRPFSERFTTFQDFDVFEYAMENDGETHDIAIAGLGWASFHARGQVIRVVLPKGVAIKEAPGKLRAYVEPKPKKAA